METKVFIPVTSLLIGKLWAGRFHDPDAGESSLVTVSDGVKLQDRMCSYWTNGCYRNRLSFGI
jgi:hypothetical protein